jgi:hypothetical protein
MVAVEFDHGTGGAQGVWKQLAAQTLVDEEDEGLRRLA